MTLAHRIARNAERGGMSANDLRAIADTYEREMIECHDAGQHETAKCRKRMMDLYDAVAFMMDGRL